MISRPTLATIGQERPPELIELELRPQLREQPAGAPLPRTLQAHGLEAYLHAEASRVVEFAQVKDVPLHDARAERHGSAKGPEPKPPRDTPEPDEQINLSDPDARLMRKSKREGYTQRPSSMPTAASSSSASA